MSGNNKLFADYLIDRHSLKTKLSIWRNIAFILIALFVIEYISNKFLNFYDIEYIARIKIDGDIFEDSKRDEIIAKISSNPKVKAVIMHVDSLGGSLYSSENLYYIVKKLSENKPTVTVMESFATSGAYMIAMPTARIFARNSTVTGSIGSLMIIPDFSKLAEKVGMKINILKSGDLKAQPQPFSPMTDKVRQYTQDSINEAYDLFIGMAKKDRDLTDKSIREVSTGATFLGQKSLALGLIDEIGAEDEALVYLYKEKNISKNLKIKDVSLKAKKKGLAQLLESFQEIQDLASIMQSYIVTLFNNISIIK
jgi:protease-4